MSSVHPGNFWCEFQSNLTQKRCCGAKMKENLHMSEFPNPKDSQDESIKQHQIPRGSQLGEDAITVPTNTVQKQNLNISVFKHTERHKITTLTHSCIFREAEEGHIPIIAAGSIVKEIGCVICLNCKLKENRIQGRNVQ